MASARQKWILDRLKTSKVQRARSMPLLHLFGYWKLFFFCVCVCVCVTRLVHVMVPPALQQRDLPTKSAPTHPHVMAKSKESQSVRR